MFGIKLKGRSVDAQCHSLNSPVRSPLQSARLCLVSIVFYSVAVIMTRLFPYSNKSTVKYL